MELLALRVDGARNCKRVRQRAQDKLVDVKIRVAALHRIRRTLEKLCTACDERAPTSECLILDALDRQDRL